MSLRDRRIPMLITAVIVSLIVFEYFFDVQAATTMSENVQRWAVVVMAFTLGLGAINLFQIHGAKVLRKGKEWYLSVWLLFIMVLTIVFGIVSGPFEDSFRFLYEDVFMHLGGTATALQGFFILSAAYRTFRARNLEAAFLVGAGILMCFYQAPFGVLIWKGFNVIGSWLFTVAVSSAFRGIIIGSAIGAIAVGVRIVLGREKGLAGG